MTTADVEPAPLAGLRVEYGPDAGGGRVLHILLPRKRALGVMFLTLSVVLITMCSFSLPHPDFALLALGSAITALITLPVGYHMVFTRHRLVVTASELRLELLPRREVLLAMPRQSIRRIVVVKSFRGEKRPIPQFELIASDVNGDHRLFVTPDEQVARTVERRLESELGGESELSGPR